MTLYMLRLFASLFFYGLTLALWSSPGVPQTFTCDTTKFVYLTTINWVLQNQSSNQSIFLCTTIGARCDASYVDDLKLYSATMASTTLEHTSVLTIENVSTSQTWFCIATFSQGGPQSMRFDLNVYDADEIPQCGHVAAVVNCQIQVTCVILTFKYGYDFSYIIKANTSTDRINPWEFNIQREKLYTTGYYKMTFNVAVRAVDLGPGTYGLRLHIFPLNDTTVEFISQYTRPFKIDYPRAFLADDCRNNDQIKETSSSSCTCYNNNTSILPTHVSWSQDNATTSTQEALYFRAICNESYQCKISNCLNWTDTIYFEPHVTVNTVSTDSSNMVVLTVGSIVGIVIAGVVVISSLVIIIVLVIHYKKKTHFQRENQNGTQVYNITIATNPYANNDVNPYEAPVIKPVSTDEYLTIVAPKVIATDIYIEPLDKDPYNKTYDMYALS